MVIAMTEKQDETDSSRNNEDIRQRPWFIKNPTAACPSSWASAPRPTCPQRSAALQVPAVTVGKPADPSHLTDPYAAIRSPYPLYHAAVRALGSADAIAVEQGEGKSLRRL